MEMSLNVAELLIAILLSATLGYLIAKQQAIEAQRRMIEKMDERLKKRSEIICAFCRLHRNDIPQQRNSFACTDQDLSALR